MKQNNHGFTLSETLVTVLLISIVFLAVSSGLPVLLRVYDEITSKANAQTMLSTAIMEVSADLKSTTIYYDTETKKIYSNQRGYTYSYVNDSDDGIVLQVTDGTKIPLLTSKTNTNHMVTKIENFSYNATVNLFSFTITIEKENKEFLSQNIQIKPNSEVTVQE